MPTSYDTSDTVFASCDTIMENFVFLTKIIDSLDDSHFEFIPKSQVRKQKDLILQELELDTAFKLLSKLEAEIKQDYNATVAKKRKDSLSKRYLDLCNKFRSSGKYNQSAEKVCRKVALNDILDEVKLFFKDTHPAFSKHCSILKGHFNFRHWYAHGRYFRRTPAFPTPRDLQQVRDEFNHLVFSRTK